MSEELKPPQFPIMLRKMWSGSEVQAWINDNWNRRAQPAAPARTLLEQYDLEQSADYRKGYEDGRLKGYEVGHRHATDTAPSVAPEPVAVALTDTFVQPVPDRCDRITWRGRYYHLPIAHPPRAPLTPEQVFADTNIMACNAKMALRMDVLMEIIRAVEAAHGISAAAIGEKT